MGNAKKLYSYTVDVNKLSTPEIQAMYGLFEYYYENTSIEKFRADMMKKDKVIILKDNQEKKIRGFSSLKFLNYKLGNKKCYGIFSGDTLIQSGFRGQSALTFEFFKNIYKFKMKHPFRSVYWFLISKGYKTYLLLTNNFSTFYPRHDRAIPPEREKVLDSFATSLFGDYYDPQCKVLRVSNLFDRLKVHSAPIYDDMLKNPNINYFNKMNPNWKDGEELCCIGRVDLGLCVKYLPRTLKKIAFKNKKSLKLKESELQSIKS